MSPVDISVSFPSAGVIRLRSRSLFGDTENPTCRRFLRADFSGRGDLERHDHRGQCAAGGPLLLFEKVLSARGCQSCGGVVRPGGDVWRGHILHERICTCDEFTAGERPGRGSAWGECSGAIDGPRWPLPRAGYAGLLAVDRGRRALHDSLLPAGPGGIRLANQVGAARAAPSQESGPLSQEFALPGNRA